MHSRAEGGKHRHSGADMGRLIYSYHDTYSGVSSVARRFCRG